MTTQYSILSSASTGLTGLTGKIFAVNGDTVLYTSDSVTERTNNKNQYLATFGESSVIPAGTYDVALFNGSGVKLSSGLRVFAGTDGETAKALDLATYHAAAGTSTGARTITIIVNDGTTVLQNARVRLTEGANTQTALTNSSGVATLNVDDATYTVSITKTGYSYAGTTLVVDGDETATYSMSAIGAITPSTGVFTTGYAVVYAQDGTVEAGVNVYCVITAAPDSETGFVYNGQERTATSDADGLVQFPGLPKGCTIELWRDETINRVSQLIPAGAGSTYELPDVFG